MTTHRVDVARELVDDIARYDQQLATSRRRLADTVAASGTTLTDIAGVGPVTAAMIIGQTGDVTRFPTAAHFASYNATAPIEASSGSRHRHRLNPRGDPCPPDPRTRRAVVRWSTGSRLGRHRH
jgi:transposase